MSTKPPCSMAETTLSNEIPRCSMSRRFFSVLQSKLTLTSQLLHNVCIMATLTSQRQKFSECAVWLVWGGTGERLSVPQRGSCGATRATGNAGRGGRAALHRKWRARGPSAAHLRRRVPEEPAASRLAGTLRYDTFFQLQHLPTDTVHLTHPDSGRVRDCRIRRVANTARRCIVTTIRADAESH